jgi:hypothetical protein
MSCSLGAAALGVVTFKVAADEVLKVVAVEEEAWEVLDCAEGEPRGDRGGRGEAEVEEEDGDEVGEGVVVLPKSFAIARAPRGCCCG